MSMNIRPIDLQVLIPKATEAGKAQHTTNQQAAIQQQEFAALWQRISAERQQQVQNPAKSEGGKVTRDKQPPEKRGSQQDGQKDTEDNSEQSKEPAKATGSQFADPVRGHKIDIKT
ncbi:hypothetical protein [Acetonema longum]|uniref:Uncharacterized protein n=1 Tax=Acetonema longum DSM 6540 TaxID=1009370 RepID=F7NL73_9FIRM|nr:hypothetical protein [Acetonema longum]EGO63178.1 hypothetical protein ALO_14227 [Acetonema longum DSM 6540]